MGQKGRERRLGFEPMPTAQQVAATSSVHPATARRWRVDGIGPLYFKIGQLDRRRVWKLERWPSQLRRLEAVA
jgi:hypothetical protein